MLNDEKKTILKKHQKKNSSQPELTLLTNQTRYEIKIRKVSFLKKNLEKKTKCKSIRKTMKKNMSNTC
jgi:hypothetical protein